MSLHPGQILQHYRIIAKIGEGGMGEVYRAEDTRLGRQVALKFLPAESEENSSSKRRLIREARAASALSHPNIVTIYSIEETEKATFIAMEFVEGDTLKLLIERNPLEASRLIEIATQLADALAAAHAAGLIHRDIKPANILVTAQGQPKILDFGLAKITEIEDKALSGENTMSRLTKTGMIMGTFSYMSPEQTRGEPLDARTDIFSLGCVLYEAATGRVPFSGPSILSILHEIATTEPPAADSLNESISQGLNDIIQRCLAKDRDKRFASASELANALRGLTFANRYQILKELGRGGMGLVYLARDPMLDREVAIKVMTPEHLSAEAVERFKREAKVVARMDHPAIVGVHDIGEHSGSLFFVMPFVPGKNLRAFLRDEDLSLGDVIEIGIQVAQALEYSHARGVVHRDIKPENIMVMREGSDIRVRVTDFGLAMSTADSRLTKTGSVVGTMAYLSPEQLSTKALDHHTDIYSLGVVMYELLTGQPPFSGEVQSVLYRISHEIPQSPRSVGADIQQDLDDLVMRCLEKDSSKRQDHARDIVDALVRYRSRLHDSERMQKLSMLHRPSALLQKPAASPFVGREKEFADLQKRLNAAVRGECQFVLVSGDAGIGKTRLLEELEKLCRVKKIPVYQGRFAEIQHALPYQGYCEMIQQYFLTRAAQSSPGSTADFSDLSSDLMSLFPSLAEIRDLSADSDESIPSMADSGARKFDDQTYVFELLARTLTRIAAGNPMVLLLEDLHAADVSIDALDYIIRRLGLTPTFVIASYRNTEIDKRHRITKLLSGFKGDRRFEVIQLAALSPSSHRLFLEQLTGGSSLDDSLAEKLYQATEGNPYFTTELARSLLDSGGIIRDETGTCRLSRDAVITSEELPVTIQQTVEDRIERLPDEAREVLSLASVLGKSFEFAHLESLASETEDLDSAVETLVRSGFIEEDRQSRTDRLTFSSGVVRDVLYAKLPRRRRRSLHKKHASDLEKKNQGKLDRIYAQLFEHYSHADETDKIIEYGFLLARKSLDAFSPEDAIRVVNTVLDYMVAEEGDRMSIAEARTLLASAHRMTGNINAALKELEDAAKAYEKEKDAGRLLHTISTAADIAWQGLKVDETRRWVEKGLGVARSSGDPAVLAKLLSLAATIASMRGEYERAQSFMEEVERIKPESQERVEEEAVSGGTLVAAMTSPCTARHPVEIAFTEEAELMTTVFETLVATDAEGNLIPHLCEKWETLEDGGLFRFELRPRVRLHDGTELTASVVKSSIERAIGRTELVPPAAFASMQGMREFKEGAAPEIYGIRVVSQNLLEIRLREKLAIFPALLADPRTAIAAPPLAEKGAPVEVFMGTGPFQVRTWGTKTIALQKFPEYWSKRQPYVDGIEFRVGLSSAEMASGFRSKELDLVRDLLPEDLEDMLRSRTLHATLIDAPQKNVYFVIFNTFSPLGQNRPLRLAIGESIRRHDLVRSTLGRFAQPAECLLPPGILGHDPGRRARPREMEDARELLKSSGLSFPLRLRASVHPILQDRYSAFLKALFQDWEQLGVTIEIATDTVKTYNETWERSEGIDLLLGRWIADYADPDNFTFGLFNSATGHFRKYFSTAQMDEMVARARTEMKPEERERQYRQIEHHLAEEGILYPLFHDVGYRVATSKLRNVSLSSSPPYVNYDEVQKSETFTAPAARIERGILQIPMAGKVESLDPSLTATMPQAWTLPAVFETLTRAAEGAKIIPWLASSFQAEQGGRRFRFRLRDGIRFHDGRRMTSRDVRYSFERLLHNKESNSQSLLAPIRGAGELMSGQSRELQGFRIVSAQEFVIELEQPLSFFPALLTYTPASIIPEGTSPEIQTWREGCIGTGPFRVTAFEPGRRLRVEANPGYWRAGYPLCGEIEFSFSVPPPEIYNAFRKGKYSIAIDLLPTDVERLLHDAEFADCYREIPSLSTYYLAFNVHSGLFADETLRHQIFRALNVPSLIRRTAGRLAVPAYSLTPPALLGYEPGPSSSDAGRVAPEMKDREISVAMHSVYDDQYQSLVKEVFGIFEQRRIRVKSTVSGAEYFSPGEAAKHDLIFMRFYADYPDADTFIYYLLHTQIGLFGKSSGSADLDRLIEAGRTEIDPRARQSIYRQAEELISGRAKVLPLFHVQTYCFARPEVDGLKLNYFIPILPFEELTVRR